MLISIGLIVLLTTIYIILYNHVTEKKVIALKIITSSLFVIIAVLACVKTQAFTQRYTKLIITALSFGFVGDILLGLRRTIVKARKALFVLGMFSFLIGHVFNILAFSIFARDNFIIYLAFSVVLTFLAILIIQLSHLKTENTRGAMYLYIFVCAFVVAYAFFNMVDMASSMPYFIAIFIGSVSFISSDFILSFLYFKKMSVFKYKVLKKINIATYYLAQTIFALSIYFIFKA